MPQLGVQIIGSNLSLRATLEQSVAAADAWADAMIGSGERAGAGIAGAIGTADEAQASLRASYAASIDEANAWGSETLAAAVRAARGLELTGVAALQAEAAYARLGLAVSRYSAGTVGEAQAVARYTATVQGLYDRQIMSANQAAVAQERAMLKFEGSLRSVGRTLSAYVTLPMAAVTYESIKLATGFQASMARVQTYAGASAMEVKKMSADILANASQLPQGPIQASESLYHLESIGIRGPKALDALKAAAIASGAGMADLTSATTALGGALVADVKGAGDAKTAMAGLVTIAGEGNMTMQDMADSMGTGLLVKAHNVGLSLREVGAAMAVMVDRGIPARRAATYLGTTFALMSAPSKSAQNALADMGVDSSRMGKMLLEPNGLLNVLNMLAAGMERVGKARGAADIMAAFGRSRQSTGILTLIESLDAKTSSYSQKLSDYDRGVADAAKRMELYQSTAQYKIHTALSQIEADFIKLGTGAMPYVAEGLKDGARAVNLLVDSFDQLPGPIKEGFGVMAAMVAIGGPVLVGVAFTMKGVRQLGIVLAELGGAAKIGAVEADTSISSIGVSADVAALQVAGLKTELASLGVAGMITPGGVVLPASVEGAGLAEGSAFSMAALGSVARTGLSRLMPGMMLAMGGQIVGGMIENAAPGTAGADIGRTVKLAGLGAGIGTMIEPGIGTAIGGTLGGIAGGILALNDALTGPSVDQQIKTLSTDVQQLGLAASQAHGQVLGLKSNLASMKLNEDSLIKRIAEDRKEVKLDPNSQTARDQLAADVAELRSVRAQVRETGNQITAAINKEKLDRKEAVAKQTQMQNSVFAKIIGATGYDDQSVGTKDFASGHFIQEMQKFGDASDAAAWKEKWGSAAQTTDLKLAQVYGRLETLAQKIKTYPSMKQIDIVINEVFHQKDKPITDAEMKNSLLHPVFADPLGIGKRLAHVLFGKPTSDATQKSAPVIVPLTRAQRVALAFSQNKYDRSTINEEIAIDNAKISHLNRERASGKINNLQYVNAVSAIYQDRQDMMGRLTQLDNKAAKDMKGYQLSLGVQAAQARADALAAANPGLQGPTSLQLQLAQEEKAAAMKAIQSNKLTMQGLIDAWNVVAQANATISSAGGFHTSLATQVAQAKADAFAASQTGLSGPTNAQLKLAEQTKAAAMKAINSHKLTMQGLIDAWNVVAQANATIAQAFVGSSRTYYRTSTDAIADSIKGLTAAQEMQLREELAQRDAHRGYRPAGAGADGFVIGESPQERRRRQHDHATAKAMGHSNAGAGAGSGSGGVYIHQAEFTIKGIEDARRLLAELEHITKRRGGQRTGTRR